MAVSPTATLLAVPYSTVKYQKGTKRKLPIHAARTSECSQLRAVRQGRKGQKSPQPGALKANLGTRQAHTHCHMGVLGTRNASADGKAAEGLSAHSSPFTGRCARQLGPAWCHCKECPCCSRHILPGNPPQSRGKETHWQHYSDLMPFLQCFPVLMVLNRCHTPHTS